VMKFFSYNFGKLFRDFNNSGSFGKNSCLDDLAQ
jgi:hypothetical protein